jgi:hypothetical protein
VKDNYKYEKKYKRYSFENDDILITVECDENQKNYAEKEVKRLLKWLSENHKSFVLKAAELFFEFAPDWDEWIDEGYSAKEFADFLYLDEIEVYKDGSFSICYECGLECFGEYRVFAEVSSDYHLDNIGVIG